MPLAWADDDGPTTEVERLEVRNGKTQMLRVKELVEDAIRPGNTFILTPATICELHELAVVDLESDAGLTRDGPVTIAHSNHVPPSEESVAGFLYDLCDNVNSATGNPVNTAAYALWRICWIHPFSEGNGRTARATAYLILCVGLGQWLPGKKTIMEQLDWYKNTKYYSALDAADVALKTTNIEDVSALEALLQQCLEYQLPT